jgi:hypothetical protein
MRGRALVGRVRKWNTLGEQKTLIIGVKIKKMKTRQTNIKMRLTFVTSSNIAMWYGSKPLSNKKENIVLQVKRLFSFQLTRWVLTGNGGSCSVKRLQHTVVFYPNSFTRENVGTKIHRDNHNICVWYIALQ